MGWRGLSTLFGTVALFAVGAGLAFLLVNEQSSLADDPTLLEPVPVPGSRVEQPEVEPVSDEEIAKAVDVLETDGRVHEFLAGGFEVTQAIPWSSEPGKRIGVVLSVQLEKPFTGVFEGIRMDWVGTGSSAAPYQRVDWRADVREVASVEVFVDLANQRLANFLPAEAAAIENVIAASSRDAGNEGD